MNHHESHDPHAFRRDQRYLHVAQRAIQTARDAMDTSALLVEALAAERGKRAILSRPLLFGQPIKQKRRAQTMRIEVDEKLSVAVPPVVDDDGDSVALTGVTFAVSDPNILEFVPDEGGDMTKGWLRAVGNVGTCTVTATVTSEGGSAEFTGSVEVGLQLPLGGDLTFGDAGVKQ